MIVNYRKIYENHIGFALPKTWHVHHIDHNKKNNDINNLVAIPSNLHGKYHHLHSEFNRIVENYGDVTISDTESPEFNFDDLYSGRFRQYFKGTEIEYFEGCKISAQCGAIYSLVFNAKENYLHALKVIQDHINDQRNRSFNLLKTAYI